MRNGRYLRIRKVKLEDQGTYVCVAYNHFGKIMREIQLVVQGKRSKESTLTKYKYDMLSNLHAA